MYKDWMHMYRENELKQICIKIECWWKEEIN
jgi:hypothetical protein